MIAKIVSAGELDAISFPWAELRYQPTQAIYTQLSDRYAFSNANKMMAALSRVLEEAWKLGQLSAEDYYKVIAIEREGKEYVVQEGDVLLFRFNV